MAMMRNAVSFFGVAVLLITAANATTHIVGDTEGWTTGVDYEEWASNNPIKVGDTIVFNYSAAYHDVLHVTKQDYDSCTTTSPIEYDNGGLTTFKALEVGVSYYICGTDGDCELGMKLKAQTTVYSDDSPSPPTSMSKVPPSETSQPPPAARSANSAHKFSSTGSFALTFAFALMMLAAV